MLSIETCIQLKEAGYPQENIQLVYFLEEINLMSQCAGDKSEKQDYIACPSFDEIWALLPNEIYYDNVNYLLTLNRLKEKSHTVISYRHQMNQLASSQLLQLVAHNPTEVAAAMWLLIKKTDFTVIKPEI
jgi:hypothetical protein